ncbi:Uncharacterised protein [[Clostridium] sordellii]|uniref:hypothetical protein n=1 Tax=Paraclostridium sordellii TaxID=1505 RepID=UPI0005E39D0E|nr:hypothetical protein [Paeniclostridium sordellii]CEQ01608.1 Uncharacterised protein [[Clostridium] sordellii] [Paeniclostridium sordellii]
MSKIKYVKYEKDLCFKCLQKKKAINTYKLVGRSYGSLYDSHNTMLQLCNECVGSIEKHNELEKWFNEKPKIIYYIENYEYEENIDAYIETLPIQGKELFLNQIAEGACAFVEDSQEWIDRELGLIEDNLEIEINNNIETTDCTYENLKLNKNDIIVIRYPSDEGGFCKINMDYMNILQKKFEEVFDGHEVLMIPDVIKISTISEEKEDI